VLLAGAGIGSVIAECLLRIGFQNITIIDGDKVELSNLNRQNYILSDIGIAKVNALYKRLKDINPSANIQVENVFLTEKNVLQYILEYDVAINAIDFTSDLPFVFDKICSEKNIPVLHPYNLGWAAALIVIMPSSDSLSKIQTNFENFEIAVVKYIIEFSKKYFDNDPVWLTNVLQEFISESTKNPPPQLSVGSAVAAALCTRIACRIVLGQPVCIFPEVYYCE